MYPKENYLSLKIVYINKALDNINEIEDHSLDFAYSIGVLHHIPDINDAIDSFCIKLKDKAPVLLYLYYKLENRGFIYQFLSKAISLLRVIISRLPNFMKVFFAEFFLPFFYTYRLVEYLKFYQSSTLIRKICH